jgi:hypothetical protein
MYIYEGIMLWNLRLGYPNFLYLKYLFRELFKKLNCLSFHRESYHLSKSHCTTFPLKPCCGLKLFYLIYNDL